MKKKVLGVGLGITLLALSLAGCGLAAQTAEQNSMETKGAAGSNGGNGKGLLPMGK